VERGKRNRDRERERKERPGEIGVDGKTEEKG
jgi:hypothetical protein